MIKKKKRRENPKGNKEICESSVVPKVNAMKPLDQERFLENKKCNHGK